MKKKFFPAFRGLKLMLQEKSVQIHLILFVFAMLLSIFLKINKYEWVLILICSGIVFSLEIINTVLEKICDFIHPNYHDKIKDMKDISSSFVLVFTLFAISIACIIFIPKIISNFL
ncbi:MAG: diacylglycerol kinase [Flavobacteriia bacterium]|nr:diacylglycerol kinase [Flavobacteriia bacterium]